MPEKKVSKPAKSDNQNLMAALTYLLGALTGIIFLLVEKNNKFIRFHAAQSTILFGALFILPYILRYVPVLGPLVNALLSLLGIILWILLLVKAYQGQYYKLPYIGDLAEDLLKKIG